MTAQTTRDRCLYARSSYEYAVSNARHVRDMAISRAWLDFEKAAATEWETYQAAMLEYEAEQTKEEKR